MCIGFGAIVTKSFEIITVFPPDAEGNISHTDILTKLRWSDGDLHLRRWIRVECSDYTLGTFGVDEDMYTPSWALEDFSMRSLPSEEMKERVEKYMERYALVTMKYAAKIQRLWQRYYKSDMTNTQRDIQGFKLMRKYADIAEKIPGGRCFRLTQLDQGGTTFQPWVDSLDLLQRKGLKKANQKMPVKSRVV